jgi:transcription termination/antitermination protein NusG
MENNEEQILPEIRGSNEQASEEEIEEIEEISQEEKAKEEIEKQKKESSKLQTEEEKSLETDEPASKIYVIKVTTNKEDNAFEMVADKVNKKKLNIYSLARPHGLRGYIFLESPDRDNAEEAVFNLPYVKGILPKTLVYADVKAMLEPVTADIKIEKNDIVEMIAEPFKKEKAKVIRIDKAKGEVVVSLLGSVVPIPTTVKIDNVRVIRREDDELEDIS